MSDILQKNRVVVKQIGEQVELTLGNVVAKFDYEAAIQIGLWLQHQGRQAKREAGDTSRNWTVIGNLTAAENGERPW